MQKEESNLFSLFYFWRQRKEHSIFISDLDGRQLSYGDFDLLSGRMADALKSAGMNVGGRVLAQTGKSIQALALYFACLRTGIIYVPINPVAPEAESLRLVADSGCHLIVCDPDAALTKVPLPAGVQLHTLTRDGMGSLLEGSPRSPDTKSFQRVDRDAVAAIMYTSGSSGLPKGVILPHRALLSNAQLLGPILDYQEDDVFLHALPLFNSHGLCLAINSLIAAGGQLLMLERFDVGQIVNHLPKATAFSGVPTMYARLLGDVRLTPEQCRRVRLFISSSAALPEHVACAFAQRTGKSILELYGLTETGTVTANRPDAKRSGSVGKTLPGVEMRVTDDEGRPLPLGMRGRLQVRKPDISPGYWRNGAYEPLPLIDGYYETGDLVDTDANAFVTIVGRTKDVVISGGFNIYPREVERALADVPAVSDCAVFGVPHPDLGEAPVAVVVSSDPETDEGKILEEVARFIGRHKLPKRIFFLDALPQNTSGKPDLMKLRASFSATFGR